MAKFNVGDIITSNGYTGIKKLLILEVRASTYVVMNAAPGTRVNELPDSEEWSIPTVNAVYDTYGA